MNSIIEFPVEEMSLFEITSSILRGYGESSAKGKEIYEYFLSNTSNEKLKNSIEFVHNNMLESLSGVGYDFNR